LGQPAELLGEYSVEGELEGSQGTPNRASIQTRFDSLISRTCP